jgi:MFS family permease
MKELFSQDFWFTQPTFTLDKEDLWFGYFMAAFVLASFIIWVGSYFFKHPVVKKGLGRWRIFLLTNGLLGLVWFAVRYENAPIFARRYWGGFVILTVLVWVFFLLKYTLFKYRKEKFEFDQQALKNKYLTGSKNGK